MAREAEAGEEAAGLRPQSGVVVGVVVGTGVGVGVGSGLGWAGGGGGGGEIATDLRSHTGARDQFHQSLRHRRVLYTREHRRQKPSAVGCGWVRMGRV